MVIATGEKLTVGGKRNLGCSLTQSSDLFAVWDDDDYSSPGRIEQQVKALEVSGKAVTGYSGMKFTDGAKWWQWQYRWPSTFVLGTSLMFRRDWWLEHPFEERHIGQDERFGLRASLEKELMVVSDSNMMYATIHKGNTSKKRMDQPGWTALRGFEWQDRD